MQLSAIPIPTNMENLKKEIIERLRAWMTKKGYRGVDITRWTGISRSSASHMLRNNTAFSLPTLVRILEHNPDLNVKWLLTGDGNPTVDADEGTVKDLLRMIEELEKIIDSKDEIIRILKKERL